MYCVSTINYDPVQNVVKYDAVQNVCCMTLHLLYDQTNIYLSKDYILNWLQLTFTDKVPLLIDKGDDV